MTTRVEDGTDAVIGDCWARHNQRLLRPQPLARRLRRPRLIIGFGLLLLFGTSAAPLAQTGPPSTPMTFRFGRFADAPECGLHCAQFVVAEGSITPASWLRLGAMMTRVETKGMPVVLDSPGGNILGAAHLARIFKANGMPAVVAIATPSPCDGPQCQGNGPFDVTAFSFVAGDGAVCASACPYAFAGSPHRFADVGSRIGVHALRLPDGMAEKLTPEARERMVAAGIANDLGEVRAVLKESGVSDEVITLAQATSYVTMAWLTPDQLVGFGFLTEPAAAANLPATMLDQLTLLEPGRFRH